MKLIQKLHFPAWISICLPLHLLFAFAVFFRKAKSILSLKGKKNEKIATVSWKNMTKMHPSSFIFFYISLQLNNSKDLLILRLSGAEKV